MSSDRKSFKVDPGNVFQYQSSCQNASRCFVFVRKSALMDAVERGDAKEVSELIDLNVDINESYICEY
eukprot:UN19883